MIGKLREHGDRIDPLRGRGLTRGGAAEYGVVKPFGRRLDRHGKELTMEHRIVSRDEWLAERKRHLAKEKAFTRLRDELSAERRRLPWVKLEKSYVFDAPDGKKTLADLFDGRSQLIV
jgi:hypothetical protein